MFISFIHSIFFIILSPSNTLAVCVLDVLAGALGSSWWIEISSRCSTPRIVLVQIPHWHFCSYVQCSLLFCIHSHRLSIMIWSHSFSPYSGFSQCSVNSLLFTVYMKKRAILSNSLSYSFWLNWNYYNKNCFLESVNFRIQNQKWHVKSGKDIKCKTLICWAQFVKHNLSFHEKLHFTYCMRINTMVMLYRQNSPIYNLII